jgi:peptidyl-tRNA hydrolase
VTQRLSFEGEDEHSNHGTSFVEIGTMKRNAKVYQCDLMLVVFCLLRVCGFFFFFFFFFSFQVFGCGSHHWVNSRESVGVRFVEHAQAKMNARPQRMHSARVDVAMANDLAFAKPLSYLTRENYRTLNALRSLFNISAERIVIVYPEVRLPIGQFAFHGAGQQSAAERSPFLRQFVGAEDTFFYSCLGIGVNAPKFRADVVVTATYTTDDERTMHTYLSNRVPRDVDDKLVATLDDVLDHLRFGADRTLSAAARAP